MALSLFHPVVADWFRDRFDQPTDVQLESWPAIVSGADTLIAAPTGSGKTLAAFLACIDDLFKQALARNLEERTQVLYVSPLKALSNDIQKNLQQPLAEIGEKAISALRKSANSDDCTLGRCMTSMDSSVELKLLPP